MLQVLKKQPLKHSTNSNKYLLTFLIGATSSLSLVPTVTAQEQLIETDENIELNTLTIESAYSYGSTTENSGSYTTQQTKTALKLPLSIQETPQSVTVITQQRMEDENLNSVGDVLDKTPGISKTQLGLAGGCVTCVEYSARGFMIKNYQFDGVNTSSGMAGGISEANTAAYDHIEIVKGATGLLSGAGNPSATINIIRKKPTDFTQIKLKSSIGTWSTYRNEIDVSGALNENGTIRGRSVFTHEQGNTWMDRVHTHKTALYSTLAIDLSENTTFNTGFDITNAKINNGGVHAFRKVDSITGDKRPSSRSDNAAPNWTYSNINRTTLFANIEHHFDNDWQLTVAATNSYLNADRIYGVLGHRYLANNQGTLTYGRDVQTPTEYAFDLFASGPFTLFNRQHELILGSSAFRSSRNDRTYRDGNLLNVDIPSWTGAIPKPDVGYNGVRNKEKEQQQGYYLATRLKPTDELAIILGGRVSNWKKDVSNQNANYTRTESGVVTPYVGTVYNLTDHWAVYASYTSIFNPQNNQTTSGSYIDPEEGKAYEMGIKGSFYEGRLNTSFAVFKTKLDNLAVTDGSNLTPSGNQAYKAENGTTTKGYEFEISGELLPDWQLMAGYTHNITKNKDSQRIKSDQNPADMVKLYTSYKFSGALDKLTIGGGMLWQSKIYNPNTTKKIRKNSQQDDYYVVNLMARYQFTDKVSASINADNLFDKKYTLNVHNYTYGTPRSLTASLSWQY